ncbi:hypothetical protein DPEC_G00308540 [Dallia pectoralis]|uniref:Uncharacterized protein n=1 Tax=Dallia pectoralis TaxID=75939 RepID=A0ACC2FEK0_DALPE|nr:hypothetical protein DPEC_G00308540 [Dallia pectoralis]
MLMCRITSVWFLLLLHVSGLDSTTWNLFSKSSTELPQEGMVRLMGGQRDSEGRVEVYHEGKWGTICDDGWDLPEAQVVCRQLRFPGAISAVTGGTYGEGSGSIWLDDMECKGTEKYLSSCSFKGWALTDCSHKEDAGVICARGTNVTDDTVHNLDHRLGMSDDLGELFDRQINCDFRVVVRSPTGNRDKGGKLEVEERTVCTHKMILSLYTTYNSTIGSDNTSIDVSYGCTPHVNSFFRYLYTRKIDVTVSSAQCLHKLASEFGVKRLMQDTGRLFTVLLPEDPTFHTQVSLYDYALQTRDLQLQENCLQFLAWNVKALINSPAWSDVSMDFMMALLQRSDLVVPDEGFLLHALELWITEKSQTINNKSQTALLSLIRFPMIPTEKLYDLQFNSEFFKSHEKLYRAGSLRGFQFNTVPFDILQKHKGSTDEEQRDYYPRIYTAEPWGININSTYKATTGQKVLEDFETRVVVYNSNRQIQNQMGYRGYQPFNPQPPPPPFDTYSSRSKSGITPNHNSVIFRTKGTNPITWTAGVYLYKQECPSCASFPTATFSLQNSLRQDQTKSVRYSNRLLLTCQGKYIFHIQDFKNNMAQVFTNSNASLTYPCPEGQYGFTFVVRPEYIG